MPLINSNTLNEWVMGIPQRARGLLADIKDAPRQIGLLFDPKFQKGLLDQRSVTDTFNKSKAEQLAMDLMTTTPAGGIAGIVKNAAGKAIPKTQYEIAHEVASKNAEKMLNLPPGNTSIDRARAMGFETAPSKATYHGARGEIVGNIDPARSDFGFHTGTLDQAEARLRAFGSGGVNFDEGANVMPLMKSKYANLLKVKDEGSFHADALAPQLEKKKILAKGKGKQIAKEIDADWQLRQQYDQMMRDAIAQHGYDGIKYSNLQEGDGISYAFSNPSVIRSRFAAFDPARANESDLLASRLLPLAGTGLLSYGLLMPRDSYAIE